MGRKGSWWLALRGVAGQGSSGGKEVVCDCYYMIPSVVEVRALEQMPRARWGRRLAQNQIDTHLLALLLSWLARRASMPGHKAGILKLLCTNKPWGQRNCRGAAVRGCCFPPTQKALSSLPLPSSADSRGCSLNDGKRKLYFTSPLAALTTLKMKEVDGKRGLGMKTSAAAGSGNRQASLFSEPRSRSGAEE